MKEIFPPRRRTDGQSDASFYIFNSKPEKTGSDRAEARLIVNERLVKQCFKKAITAFFLLFFSISGDLNIRHSRKVSDDWLRGDLMISQSFTGGGFRG